MYICKTPTSLGLRIDVESPSGQPPPPPPSPNQADERISKDSRAPCHFPFCLLPQIKKPLSSSSSELGIHETLMARLWPWLEPVLRHKLFKRFTNEWTVVSFS